MSIFTVSAGNNPTALPQREDLHKDVKIQVVRTASVLEGHPHLLVRQHPVLRKAKCHVCQPHRGAVVRATKMLVAQCPVVVVRICGAVLATNLANQFMN